MYGNLCVNWINMMFRFNQTIFSAFLCVCGTSQLNIWISNGFRIQSKQKKWPKQLRKHTVHFYHYHLIFIYVKQSLHMCCAKSISFFDKNLFIHFKPTFTVFNNFFYCCCCYCCGIEHAITVYFIEISFN